MTLDIFLHTLLLKLKINYSFGIPGAAIMPWFNFLYSQSEIKHITTTHENSSAYMAMHYSLVTKKLGVCYTTTGPGVSNIITGVAAAYSENIPLLIITGEVRRNHFGRNEYQESTGYDNKFNSVDIMKTVCKSSQKALNGAHFARLLINSYNIAFHGIPGPVHISVPFDVWQDTISTKTAYNLLNSIASKNFLTTCNDRELATFTKNLKLAKFPILLLGRGVIISHSGKLALKFSKKINIPIITTTRGKGIIPNNTSSLLGNIGMVPSNISKKYLDKIDLIIAVGTSLSPSSIGSLFKDIKTITININPTLSENTLLIENQIVSDALFFFKRIFEVKIDKEINFSYKINKIKRDKQLGQFEKKIKKELDSQEAIQIIEDTLHNDIIILPDAGSHWIWSMKYLSNRRINGILAGRSLGGMGQAIVGSIGVSLALPSEKIVCITGDGSFLMQGNEISIASQNNSKILFILFNDSALGRIYHAQKEDFQEKIIGTTYPRYNYAKIAKGLKLFSKRIKTQADLKRYINKWQKNPKPTLIEIIINKNSGLPS